jgi:hypothetical protein
VLQLQPLQVHATADLVDLVQDILESIINVGAIKSRCFDETQGMLLSIISRLIRWHIA